MAINMKETILNELNTAKTVLDAFLSNESNILAIEKAATLMIKTLKDEGKILSCGNGGSACDAAHFAEEMTGRFRENRKALAAIAMTDMSHITCVSNDFGYSHIFSRYMEALGKKGDCLLAISTSGNSENVLLAAKAAKQMGAHVIALTGKNGGKLAEIADVEIRAAHHGYSDRIQEIHIKVIHILIQLIEDAIV